jgi:serine/threonine-protein kinase
MEPRYCPLCDEDSEAEYCPTHGVPTIALSPRREASLRPGMVIGGRHRIERELGQGGMGGLFVASQLGMDRRVVVKAIAEDGTLPRRQALQRIYREALAISKLSHPNVVRVFELGVDGPTQIPFIVMELVEGRTLRQIIDADGPLGEPRAAALFVQIARGLMEAHKHGILHRDLKPTNIMVTLLDDGVEHARILDFGIARLVHGERLTAPGKVVGTPSYMSPEQILEGPQDFRTDLYGLGCILHTALTGGPPFTGKDIPEVLAAQLRSEPPPLPPALSDGRPPSDGLRALHRRLLAKSRLDRPESTLDVVRAFATLEPDAGDPSQWEETLRPNAETEPVSLPPSAPPEAFSEAATLRPPKEKDDPISIASAETLSGGAMLTGGSGFAGPGPEEGAPTVGIGREITAVMPKDLDPEISAPPDDDPRFSPIGPPQRIARAAETDIARPEKKSGVFLLAVALVLLATAVAVAAAWR